MEWISVEKNKPKENQECLVAFYSDKIPLKLGHCYNLSVYCSDTFYSWELMKKINVTHWMPLPEPPDDKFDCNQRGPIC